MAAGASVFNARVVIVVFSESSEHISSLIFNYYYAHELLVEFWEKKIFFILLHFYY